MEERSMGHGGHTCSWTYGEQRATGPSQRGWLIQWPTRKY